MKKNVIYLLIKKEKQFSDMSPDCNVVVFKHLESGSKLKFKMTKLLHAAKPILAYNKTVTIEYEGFISSIENDKYRFFLYKSNSIIFEDKQAKTFFNISQRKPVTINEIQKELVVSS